MRSYPLTVPAEQAYEAYRLARAHMSASAPSWSELRIDEQQAWVSATAAVLLWVEEQ